MDIETLKPTFLITIEGKTLSKDITQEITSLTFEDNEEELDVLELSITDRNLQFVDDPLFQEGNEVTARFGYVGNLSPRKVAVIKDIDYDFPESGDPTIKIKAYDKGFKLAGKVNQKVWQKPAPGILYSEIAEAIAAANGLTPVVTPTKGFHLRVTQSNISDAQFLKELAVQARDRDGAGTAGYVFFVQDDELHFHPRGLEKKPELVLEYFTDKKGVLRNFRPSTQSQGAKGPGVETKVVGVDPRMKAPVEHKANNETTPERTSLGARTYLVDGNTGEAKYKEQESGRIVPTTAPAEAQHEPPAQPSHQDAAEGKFKAAELKQVEASAATIGIPALKAKRNIEVKGVGQKFSGIWYCTSVRHSIGSGGYACELKLKRNALGKGAGEKSDPALGQKNTAEAPRQPQEPPATPPTVTIDGNTGAIRG